MDTQTFWVFGLAKQMLFDVIHSIYNISNTDLNLCFFALFQTLSPNRWKQQFLLVSLN